MAGAWAAVRECMTGKERGKVTRERGDLWRVLRPGSDCDEEVSYILDHEGLGRVVETVDGREEIYLFPVDVNSPYAVRTEEMWRRLDKAVSSDARRRDPALRAAGRALQLVIYALLLNEVFTADEGLGYQKMESISVLQLRDDMESWCSEHRADEGLSEVMGKACAYYLGLPKNPDELEDPLGGHVKRTQSMEGMVMNLAGYLRDEGLIEDKAFSEEKLIVPTGMFKAMYRTWCAAVANRALVEEILLQPHEGGKDA